MDLSRAFIKVNDVQDSQSLPPDMIPYTGKGVVIGMIDGGIDPHHVTFLNSDRTESRVKRFIQTKSSEETSDNFPDYRQQIGAAGDFSQTNFGRGEEVAENGERRELEEDTDRLRGQFGYTEQKEGK